VVDISLLFGAILFVDALAILALLWVEHFTRFEGIVLWEEESPFTPLFWGSVIVLLAGILSLIDLQIWARPAVLVNVGGLLAPLAVSAILLVRRRPKVVPFCASIAVTFVLTVTCVALVGRPFYIPFPASLFPSAGAAVVGLAFSRERLLPSLDLAYTGASIGVFLGLDLVWLPGYLANVPSSATGIVLGGGGILDLIFLAGVLAVAIAWIGAVALQILRRSRGEGLPTGAEPAIESRTFLWQRR